MPLDRYAFARTLVATVGAGAVSVSSSNPVMAASTFAALSSGVNELLSTHKESTSLSLVGAFTNAVEELLASMDGQLDQIDATEILSAISHAIANAEETSIRELLVAIPNIASVSDLLRDTDLSQSQNDLAKAYLAQALALWHRHLVPDSSTVQAFRELLGDMQRRVSGLETEGLDFGIYQPYVHGAVAPSQLFRPESRVLSLIGREDELARLSGWCDSDSDFSAQALAAPGGTGKTRLALKLMENQRLHGWFAALVKKQGSVECLTGVNLPINILLVIDYADYRVAELEVTLATMRALVASGKRLRLLLLARPDNDWWDDAKRLLKMSFYQQCKVHPPQLIALPSPISTDPITVAQVLRQVERLIPHSLPSDHADFSLPVDGTPLMWMMAAYRFLQPDRKPQSDEAGELCDEIVMHHERNYLRSKLGGDFYLPATLQALALLTFAGGVHNLADPKATDKLLRRVPDLANVDSPTLNAIHRILASTYPRYNGIDALRPDLLGEYLCEQQLDETLLQAFIRWCIQQLEDNKCEDKSHTDWLLPLVQADNNCHRLGQWRGATMGLPKRWENALNSLNLDEISALASADEQDHLLLRELSLRLNNVHLVIASEDPIEYAAALNNRSIHLSALGDREGALDAIKQSVDSYRLAAETDSETFNPKLAASLNNLGLRLSDLGRNESAFEVYQEAVDICRLFVQQSPDFFVPILAMSLSNITNVLSKLGQNEAALSAAQEAVYLYRQLAHQYPKVFKGNLSRSLINLANRLRQLNQFEPALTTAQEAVDLYLELYLLRPDAFKANLALSLNNLAGRLGDLGKDKRALLIAQQAVDLRRELVELYPRAFTADLAMSLGTVAGYLAINGRIEEASECALESTGLFAQLWQQYSQAFSQYTSDGIRLNTAIFEAAGLDKEESDKTLMANPAILDFLRHTSNT